LISLRGMLLASVVAAGIAEAQPKTSAWLTTNFQARTHTSPEVTMAYRLFKPANYDSTRKYPIVVALHGGGERGSDNAIQLTREELAQPWVRDSVQAKHPHFVMVPQCPSNLAWSPSNTWDGNRSLPNIGIVRILDSLKREFSLDTTRFYVVGLSMGGFASFELMKWTPNLFAAAVPTAGGGDTAAPAIAQMIKTPMWAFHSLTDPTVSAQRGSRTLVSKMEAALGKPIPRSASDTGLKNPVAFDSLHGVITVDSLRRLVYVDSAHFLYSEVRNAPGTGNALHQAGWFIAWRHPMLTDWLFSKRKVNGVTSLVNPVPANAKALNPHVRLVMGQNNRVLLERTSADGRTALYTLEGKRVIPAGASR
jgi:predicted peptidase